MIYKSVFQEFQGNFSWTYDQMPGIDPNIIVHEIKMYPDAKEVQQHLHLIHPKKVVVIKVEV